MTRAERSISRIVGQRVAFVGRLATLTRHAAFELVRRLGATPVDHVNRTTSLLVVGMAGGALLGDGTISRKLARAEALQAGGAALEIISEAEFRARTGLDAAGEAATRADARLGANGAGALDAEQIAALLNVTPETLTRWEQLSLVRSHDGRYDFHDVVTLRTIARLLADGVRPEAIARGWRDLARVLPEAERSLAQVRAIKSDELAAELGETLISASGQMLLNFDPPPETIRIPASGISADASRGADPHAPGDAESWLRRGAELEGEELLDEAAAAYRAALALRPDFADAHFNLGNVLRELGDETQARRSYEAAVRNDPHLAAAWYNLADLAEQSGDLSLAAEWLRRAVGSDPGYADAHYNLAYVEEQLGRRRVAARHWSAYLRLDPSGPWAAQARQRLAACEE